jgi:hypothetical protein
MQHWRWLVARNAAISDSVLKTISLKFSSRVRFIRVGKRKQMLLEVCQPRACFFNGYRDVVDRGVRLLQASALV